MPGIPERASCRRSAALASGCGSSSSQVQNSKSAEYSYSAAEADYGVFGETGAAGGAGSYDYASDVSYEEAYPEEAAEEGITEEDVILEDGKDHEDSPESKRKLITTVNISVQTKEFDVLQKSIETSVEELGGYIESSESITTATAITAPRILRTTRRMIAAPPMFSGFRRRGWMSF